MKNEFTFLKFVPYKNISGWDIRVLFNKAVKLKYPAVKLKDLITPFKKDVSKKSVQEKDISIISKINFGGELFLREKEEVKTYKGKLFLIEKDLIIFSKINARNGCIYYHNEDFEFAVSSEYPALNFDKSKINGQFLWLLLRSNFVKNVLKSKATGHSKARVTYEDFYELEIPLPTLKEQQSLIDGYNQDLSKAKAAEDFSKQLEKEIETFLLTELGIEIKTKSIEKGLQFVRFKEVDKWGIDFILKTKEITKGKYQTFKIGQICKVGSGGTPSRTNKNYYGGTIPWIKTGEVVNSIIYDTEEKITDKAVKESSAKLFTAGSLIIAMYGQGLTRGRTAKLGVDATTNQACAVLHDINNDLILTDYLWIYLQNEYHRLRELASGNNQPNLNAGMIYNYDIQVPPKAIQEQIISEVMEKRKFSNSHKEQVEKLKINAKEQFEMELIEK